MFSVPESNGFMKKRSHSFQGPALQIVSGVCVLCCCVSLFLPSGQFSAEVLLSFSGQCFVSGQSVPNAKCDLMLFPVELKSCRTLCLVEVMWARVSAGIMGKEPVTLGLRKSD